MINETLIIRGNIIFPVNTDRSELHKNLHNAIVDEKWDDLSTFMQCVSGFFLIIYHLEDSTILITDRIRSRNALISKHDNQYTLSSISEVLERSSVNGEFQYERLFCAAGYVLGHDTLIKNTFQLLAAEITLLTRTRLIRKYYDRFYPSEIPMSYQEAQESMQAAMVEAVNEMVTKFDGRHFLVPLSGGYDSRLLLLLLINAGVPKSHIKCFTYGDLQSREVVTSKKVAKLLEVEWICIPQDKNFWVYWSQDREQEFNDYMRSASHLASCPVIQDWPVIGELLARRYIDNTYVVVPGHAGDFIAGSHLSADLLEEDKRGQGFSKLVQKIMNKHIALHIRTSDDSREFAQDLRKYEFPEDIRTDVENGNAASAFEWWDWRERQCKLIANSVIAYDHWGLDWWCPFWAKSPFDTFQSIPQTYRLNTTCYVSMVNRICCEIGDLHTAKIGSDRDTIFSMAVKLLKDKFLRRSEYLTMRGRRKRFQSLSVKHPMGWNYILGIKELQTFNSVSFYHPFSILSLRILRPHD